MYISVYVFMYSMYVLCYIHILVCIYVLLLAACRKWAWGYFCFRSVRYPLQQAYISLCFYWKKSAIIMWIYALTLIIINAFAICVCVWILFAWDTRVIFSLTGSLFHFIVGKDFRKQTITFFEVNQSSISCSLCLCCVHCS